MIIKSYKSIESTQKHLLKNPSKNILIATKRQTKGIGRHNSSWFMMDGTLAFSFICNINEIYNEFIIEEKYKRFGNF